MAAQLPIDKERFHSMFPFASRRTGRHRSILGGALVALGATAAVASGSAPTLLAGTAQDAAADAPAGFDVTSLHASYSPTSGSVMTTVKLAGKPAHGSIVEVVLGTSNAAGACDISGPSVRFIAGDTRANWSAPGQFGKLAPTQRRAIPKASSTMVSAIRVAAYRGKSWNCATAGARLETDSAPADVATTTLTSVPDGRVAPITGNLTMMQLDQGYGYTARIRDGRMGILVTCIASASRTCRGTLTVAQQGSHRKLGQRSFTMPLGASRTIRVPVQLTSGLKRLRTLYSRVTLKPRGGPSTWTLATTSHS